MKSFKEFLLESQEELDIDVNIVPRAIKTILKDTNTIDTLEEDNLNNQVTKLILYKDKEQKNKLLCIKGYMKIVKEKGYYTLINKSGVKVEEFSPAGKLYDLSMKNHRYTRGEIVAIKFKDSSIPTYIKNVDYLKTYK